jgi:uncharacterized membrane protein
MRLTRAARNHWHHHSRFYFSALAGGAVWAITWAMDTQLRVMLAGDAFYVAYLIAMALLANRITPAQMRKRSSVADEGGILIVLITLAVIGFSTVSLFGLLDRQQKADWLILGLSIASIPLGWFTLQLIMAYRYSHLYYIRANGKAGGAKGHDTGGLDFPGTGEPTAWDFIYYSFVVGMTAQVSDVDVTSTDMRKVTWAHGVVAFFYNAVLIALAVNIAVQSSGG